MYIVSSVPATLEELQYEVLQGDLSINEKLQPSAVPALDKELKTVAKKIIPAINEILKLVNVCKQSVETYSADAERSISKLSSELTDFSETMEKTQDEMLATLKSYCNEAINQQMSTLQKSIDKLIQEKIDTLDLSGVVSGDGEMKRVFHSKVSLAKDATATIPYNVENFDPNRQMEVYARSSKTSSYILVPHHTAIVNDENSIMKFSTPPVDLSVDVTTGALKLRNSSGAYAIEVYLFDLV